MNPWEEGSERDRWDGYLDFQHFDRDAGEYVMLNKLDATTYADLRKLEDAAVQLRALRARGLGIPHSYDLDGLKEVHGYLFQDVYPWAGQERTVNMAKGRGKFAEPETFKDMTQGVWEHIDQTDALRSVPREEVPVHLAAVYDTINKAHIFREGNGRTDREFLSALAAETGHELDWSSVQGPVNDAVSEEARSGNLKPMAEMFQRITRDAPAPVKLPEATRASFPESATRATEAQPATTQNQNLKRQPPNLAVDPDREP